MVTVVTAAPRALQELVAQRAPAAPAAAVEPKAPMGLPQSQGVTVVTVVMVSISRPVLQETVVRAVAEAPR